MAKISRGAPMQELPHTPKPSAPMTPQERQMAARRAAQQLAEQSMQKRRAEQLAAQQAAAQAAQAAMPAGPAQQAQPSHPANQAASASPVSPASGTATAQPARQTTAFQPVGQTPPAATPAQPAQQAQPSHPVNQMSSEKQVSLAHSATPRTGAAAAQPVAPATEPDERNEASAAATAFAAVETQRKQTYTARDKTPKPPKPAKAAHRRKEKSQPAETLIPDEEAAARRGANRWYTLGMIVFAVIFLFSAGMLISRLISDRNAESEFADLESLIAEQPAEAAGGDAPVDNTAKFAALSAKNPDFLGWISIQGTNLNFPVMYKPDGDQYYLRRNFSGDYSVYGVPYLDEKCTANPMSNNMVIYGHNMKTGTIFGCLTDYKNASNYQAHPTIEFDTLYGDGTYEVWGAFAIDVATDTSFAYNTYLNMDEARFNEFVSQVKSRSDVDSGITPVYGDQLLTLSTCEYSSNNGRYVVCARRVEPAPE